jgi:hypothetical protein
MTTLSQPHAHPRVTLGAVGAAPNANGATLTGQALVLELASTSFPGLITAAEKTKLNNLSGANTGDVTLGAFGATPNANGLSLVNQVLNMQPASATNPGGVSTTTQTFAGDKTFNNVVASAVASGSDAFTVLAGARINLRGVGGNAYLHSSASALVHTNGNLRADGYIDAGGTVYSNTPAGGFAFVCAAGTFLGVANSGNRYFVAGTGLINTPVKLTADAGIGVGNSAAASALGTVVKKMEVFDAAGASLGFVPIYNSIT